MGRNQPIEKGNTPEYTWMGRNQPIEKGNTPEYTWMGKNQPKKRGNNQKKERKKERMKKKLMKTAAVVLAVSLVTGAWAASGGTVLAETAGTESSADVDGCEETETSETETGDAGQTEDSGGAEVLQSNGVETLSADEIIDSGTCGDDLTWVLTGDGTLTISGTGEMEDYSEFSNAPWFSLKDDIVAVVIENGVTSIGTSAFFYCSSLTSITIPDGVTNIGNSAFFYCSSLTSITIPDGVTSIEHYTFTDCSSLTSITIPDSVTSIGNSAFADCSSLTSITIPDSVTSIGNYTFNGCSSLTSITIPDGVTSIGGGTFSGCSSLTSITIPNSVTSIGRFAFYICSSLTDVYYAGSVDEWNEIEIIDISPYLLMATIHYNSTGPDSTGTETGTAEEYIQQHIEYYNSDQYASDIINPESSDYLTLVLEEVESNYAAYAYNAFDELTGFYESVEGIVVDVLIDSVIGDIIDLDIVTDEDYYLLIANLMLNDEEYSGIQESLLTNYMESCSTVIEACISVATGYDDLPGYDDLITKAEEVKNAAKLMGSDLETFYKIMQTFLSDMDSALSVAGELSNFLNDLTSILSSTCKNFSKVYSYGEKLYGVLDDAINYYCYGLAYVETSNEFKVIISQMTSYAYEQSLSRKLEWYSIGTDGYEYRKLYQTLVEFEEDMEKYADDSEEAIFSSITGDFSSLGIGEGIKQLENYLKYTIPGAGQIMAVIDLGIDLVDIFTYIDDQAAPAKMMYKSSYIAKLLDGICDYLGESLIIEDKLQELGENRNQELEDSRLAAALLFDDSRLATALLFDKAVNMYKNSMLFVCDYAAEYSRIALEAEQDVISSLDSLADTPFDYDPVLYGISSFFMKNASLYSTMMVCASTQKLVTSEIECHDASIQYDFTEDSEIYDTRDMNIFVIACPVSVTVLDEKGEQIAYLSDDLSEVKDGYEHYFFACQGAESSTGLKVAAVPLDEDYTIILEGTGEGNMYVSSVICRAGVMENLLISEPVPVTETSTGTLVSEQNGNLIELLFDGKEYEFTEYTEENIENAEISVSGGDYYYTGSEIEPVVKVTYNGVELRLGTDYEVTYSDNIEPGTATITVKGTGYFTGTAEINFEIISSLDGKITLPDLDNGTVSISDMEARAGDEVTVSVIPDDGYELWDLTIMDSEGNSIEITENGNGEYIFVMPEGEITISVTFTPVRDGNESSTGEEVSEDPSDSGDDTTGEGFGDDGSSSVTPDDDAETEDPGNDGTSSGDDTSGEGSANDGTSSSDDVTGEGSGDEGSSAVTSGDDTGSGSSGADDNTADVPDDDTSADGTADGDGSTSTDDGTSVSSGDTSDDGSSQVSGSDEDGQASEDSSSTSSGDSAQTGDNSNVVIWFMLLVAGGAATVPVIRRKRKRY